MSKIAIIGATGRAGSQLLEEALRRGHSVLAIARDPSRLQGRDGVTVKALDAKDSAALQAAVEGVDAVLSAAHFSTIEPHAIIEPVKRAGVKRLLVVGGGRQPVVAVGAPGDRQPGLPGSLQGRGHCRGAFSGGVAARAKPGLDLSLAVGGVR